MVSSPMVIYSQEMPPDGGVNQDGISKLLAKEASNPWPTFFREVFQNSNDARISPLEPFTFRVETSKIGPDAAVTIRNAKSDNGVAMSALSSNLPQLSDSSTCLVVTDLGTTGLGGSTDPRLAEHDSRFANFFFKYGRESGNSHDGGAFGFGRNVFFSASKVSTVFVYTRYRNDQGVTSSRLMGMTANKHFTHGGRNFTGRHWWCEAKNSDGSYLPFSGPTADQLADTLGFTAFPDGQTGTSVMVLSPNSSEIHSLAQILQATALVSAWPHFLDEPGRVRAKFVFKSFGETLLTVEPTDSKSPLAPFAAAFLEAVNNPNSTKKLTCSSVHQALRDKFSDGKEISRAMGGIVSEQFPKQVSPQSLQFFEDSGLPKSSAIALMRSPRIIVKYLQVGDVHSEIVTLGCFIVDPEWDPIFREAENLTHDEWEPSRLNLPKRAANPVNQTLTKIPEMFVDETKRINGSGSGNASLADEIGAMLSSPSLGGYGISVDEDDPINPDPTPRVNKPKIVLKSKKLLQIEENCATALFIFEVRGHDELQEHHLSAVPFVMTASGREVASDAPVGSMGLRITSLDIRSTGVSQHEIDVKVEFETGTMIGIEVNHRNDTNAELPHA